METEDIRRCGLLQIDHE